MNCRRVVYKMNQLKGLIEDSRDRCIIKNGTGHDSSLRMIGRCPGCDALDAEAAAMSARKDAEWLGLLPGTDRTALISYLEILAMAGRRQ